MDEGRCRDAAVTSKNLAVGIDQHRDVAWSNTDSGIAAAVGRAHNWRATCGNNDINTVVSHQRVNQRNRRVTHDLDDAVRRASLDGRFVHDVSCLCTYALG